MGETLQMKERWVPMVDSPRQTTPAVHVIYDANASVSNVNFVGQDLDLEERKIWIQRLEIHQCQSTGLTFPYYRTRMTHGKYISEASKKMNSYPQ